MKNKINSIVIGAKVILVFRRSDKYKRSYFKKYTNFSNFSKERLKVLLVECGWIKRGSSYFSPEAIKRITKL